MVGEFRECAGRTSENRPERLNFGEKVTLRETKLLQKVANKEMIFEKFPTLYDFFLSFRYFCIPLSLYFGWYQVAQLKSGRYYFGPANGDFRRPKTRKNL